MTSKIAAFVGKKILAESVQNKFGTEDPYFEMVPATRLDGTPNGKFKKRRKALPPGISKHDAKVLTKVKRRAYRLDMSLFNCCGVRFGWSSVIGIIPAIGDVFDALLAMMVLRTCMTVEGGIPTALRTKMMLNIMFDFVIGIVPFVGDVMDAAFKANSRNAALLEAYLREKGQKELRKSGLPIPEVDPSLPEEFDRAQRDDLPDYTEHQPRRNERMTAGVHKDGLNVTAPSAHAPAKARKNDRRGWSFFGRPPSTDVEMAEPDRNITAPSKSNGRQQRRP
ncbi:hypothetical protein jhhlp_002147 [Lomentospora prolificans]|uniref:PH domain-containing protein n=1 Tax=Lomentospora prolificans TaxID=41688 RepID=A0A2N3ND64_9PEZI|nr:hypothetical protein jhhlp_002147 [Lomentospora prolificans]